jgi:hypothetical protein
MRNLSFSALFSAFLVTAALGMATTEVARAQSVMKQCGEEWKAAKANNTTNGQTWPEFLKSCRARLANAPAAAPAPAPAAAPAAAPAPAPAPVQAAARPTGAGQFQTEAEARARCPSDKVVWVNTKSRIYHYEGARSYGTTKRGAYMCEADATAAGDRAAKGGFGKKTQQQ